MTDSLTASTIRIAGFGGEEIEAYLAQSGDDRSRGGVVVIHHLPGYDRATKEITRRFAELGYDAICPNLFWHDAPGASPDDAAAAGRAKGGAPDDRVVGDVAGAMDYLTSLPRSNGKAGVIGYCSGGRQTVLVACSLPFAAAVDCYGAYVVGQPPAGLPSSMVPIADRLSTLSCPLLGLFGAQDKAPSPEHVAELSAILDRHGKQFEFHSYDNAGHGFFAPDRPSYRVEAAVDGWARIVEFFGRELA